MKLFLLCSLSSGLVEAGPGKQNRKRAKVSKAIYWGNQDGMFDSFERQGASKCHLRSNNAAEQCCEGVDLECFGCNQVLLDKGEKCAEQTTSTEFGNRRDCFCDSSCILFEDCCDDHPLTCYHLYPDSTKSTTTTTTAKPTTTTTTTTTSTTTTTETTTTASTTTTQKTTKETTTQGKDNGDSSDSDDGETDGDNGDGDNGEELKESWIFVKLFDKLTQLIDEKFDTYPKEPNMVKKLFHYQQFWVNAEHNCRHIKKPFLGEPDDGKIKTYDDIWDGLKAKSDNDWSAKMNLLTSGFDRYMREYYYEGKTVGTTQGCDGKRAKGNKRRGIHYKQKRYGRKMIKAMYKISRRKPITKKEKRENKKKNN